MSSSKSKKLEGNPDASLTSIGNYVFQKTVGEGNFAKVKLAKHKITGQEVGHINIHPHLIPHTFI